MLQYYIMVNLEIANLVDGVTKLSKMNFSTKQEQNYANTRKIITGITDDARIIIIKLADRLHNMRILEYKNEFKQKENSIETMEIFIPLAYLIGAYKIKSELEDISFGYLYPKEYKDIEERLRFDFTLDRKMTAEELKKVSDIVNEAIALDIPITCQEMTLEEARTTGAIGIFGDKYGEKVRVYTIGDYSKEICGGPHAQSTGELKNFKIIKEQSSSAKVRRIKAIIDYK